MMKKYLLVHLLAFFSLISASSWAEPLKIGVGISKPPYIIEKTNSGMELDILRRALALAGYDMKPHYMPLLRIPHGLNGGALDGGMPLKANLPVDAFFSNEVLTYQNYAIALASNDLKIRKISDLGRLRVVAFQNASKFLGEDFSRMVTGNSSYSEVANQELQIKMLLGGRVDVVVSDVRIFLHFKKLVEEKLGNNAQVNLYPLFTPTAYRAAFRDRSVRDAFDEALKKMRANGEYDEIIANYISADDLKHVRIVESR